MWNKSCVDGPITIWTYKEPDEEGNQLPDQIISGYHLNFIKSELPEEAEPYTVIPTTPRRLFAGDDGTGSLTAFLLFENEEEAKQVLHNYWIEEESE